VTIAFFSLKVSLITDAIFKPSWSVRFLLLQLIPLVIQWDV
jgi:hypothetical protein